MPSRTKALFFGVILSSALSLHASPQLPQAPTSPPAPPPQQQAQPQAPQQSQLPPQSQPPPAEQPPAPRNALGVVVLDPAHGGADTGARGASGLTESDVVLGLARLVRISLEAQGLRVVLTRQAAEDPSFDDRSKIANAQRGAIFISLHVSSTGPPGAVRVYSLPQRAPAADPAPARPGPIHWEEAQLPYLDLSRNLAAAIQTRMARLFRGSPDSPPAAPVRQLRNVAVPAVAIEISSVSVPDRTLLDRMAPVFADSLARGVADFRPMFEASMK